MTTISFSSFKTLQGSPFYTCLLDEVLDPSQGRQGSFLIFYASFYSLCTYSLIPTPFCHSLNSYLSLITHSVSLLWKSLSAEERGSGRRPLLFWDPTLRSRLCNGAWQATTQCLASRPDLEVFPASSLPTCRGWKSNGRGLLCPSPSPSLG